jgi:hypothetical protein
MEAQNSPSEKPKRQLYNLNNEWLLASKLLGLPAERKDLSKKNIEEYKASLNRRLSLDTEYLVPIGASLKQLTSVLEKDITESVLAKQLVQRVIHDAYKLGLEGERSSAVQGLRVFVIIVLVLFSLDKEHIIEADPSQLHNALLFALDDIPATLYYTDGWLADLMEYIQAHSRDTWLIYQTPLVAALKKSTQLAIELWPEYSARGKNPYREEYLPQSLGRFALSANSVLRLTALEVIQETLRLGGLCEDQIATWYEMSKSTNTAAGHTRTMLAQKHLFSGLHLEGQRVGAIHDMWSLWRLGQLGRYPTQLLLDLEKDMHKSDKPTFIALMCRYDREGDRASQKYEQLQSAYESIRGWAYLRIMEFTTQDQLIERISEAHGRYGPLAGFMIESHGPTSIKNGGSTNITPSDIWLRQTDWLPLRTCFAQGALGVIDVCSATSIQQNNVEKTGIPNISLGGVFQSMLNIPIVVPNTTTRLVKWAPELLENGDLQYDIQFSSPKCSRIYRGEDSLIGIKLLLEDDYVDALRVRHNHWYENIGIDLDLISQLDTVTIIYE